MMPNAIGRRLPARLPGLPPLRPFAGAFATGPSGARHGPPLRGRRAGGRKLVRSIDDALAAIELRDGMWISFHHHLRNGDRVVQLVLDAAARRGVRDLTLVPTALFPTHASLLPHI